MLRERIQKFHFVGIGGIGMSGIARILLEMGYQVSGSDLRENDRIRELRSLGAEIYLSHSAENVGDAQVVVYSSAVPQDNPEIRRAKETGIPTISRGEMLAELFRMKEGIAVSGTHGKTTTTSMVAHILQRAGFDPTVIIGGVLRSLGSNARLGRGDLLVSEADESDGSFLKLYPAVAVVTNIDEEHLDFYGSFSALKEAFLSFVERVPFYGFSVLNADDAGCREILRSLSRRAVTFGLGTEAAVRARNLKLSEGGYLFEVSHGGDPLGTLHLRIPGRHNVYNALAATAVALELGVDFGTVKTALESFRNAQRRLELKGYLQGAPVYDDYGHHPTEIREVLRTLRELYPEKRILLVFQPHRYSRTHYLFEKFAEVLREADTVLLTDIFPAGERNTYAVSAEELARRSGALYVPSREELFDRLRSMVTGEEVVAFVGAGSISRWCDEVLSDHSISTRSSSIRYSPL